MSEAVSNAKTDAQRIAELEQTVESLTHQLDWFKRQLFGRKSEKRDVEPNPHQPLLDGFQADKPSAESVPETETITYKRKKRRGDDCVNDSGLRFDSTVPMKTIRCHAPELEGDGFEVIREERTYRLAQRSSYVVIEYIRPVVKRRADDKLITTPAPPSLFPGTVADVSLIAGLIVDKLVYHQPLYRQHQRMGREGITLARGTLTNLVHRAATLLAPIAEAQLQSILQSKVLAIDESVPRRLEATYG